MLKKMLVTASLVVASMQWAAAADVPTAEQWAVVQQAAKKEGKVVIYASTFGSDTYKAVVKSFEAKYGIAVETLDIRASEMYERVRVEQSSNRFIGDIVLQPRSIMVVMERGNTLEPHEGVPNMKNLRQGMAPDELRVPLYSQVYGILVNASVPEADGPKSWHDLLEPKWKGKLILDDPRAIGNGFSLFNATYKAFGPDFQLKLSQQSPFVSRQVRNDERRVAQGEYPLYAPHNFTFFGELKGLPVRFVFPSDGCPNADTMAVVLRNAPHKNAARLFINHVLDTEPQVIYGNSGLLPGIDGLADKLDQAVRPMFGCKLLPQVNVDEMNEIMGKAKELYK